MVQEGGKEEYYTPDPSMRVSQLLGVVVVRNVFPGLMWSHWSHLQPMAADQNNYSKCLKIPE